MDQISFYVPTMEADPGATSTTDKAGSFMKRPDDNADETIELSGELSSGMGVTSTNAAYNTLDEPVFETLMRDVKAVSDKFAHVLRPGKEQTQNLLNNWDLWGPLILCTIMAFMMHSSEDQYVRSGMSNIPAVGSGPQFTEIFVIVWLGSVFVTYNTQLLGGQITFCQSTCVIGYCMLPLTIALIICRLITLVTPISQHAALGIRLAIVGTALAWAIKSSSNFMYHCQSPNRRLLASYPICLFYFLLSWMILLS